MKFCHGEKHGNLQHSPQIHTCPLSRHWLLPLQMHCLFSLAWPCPKYSFAASTSSPTPARSSFPSRHWEGSLFCVFHRAYALPGLGRSASIHVSPHICFQPGSPQLSRPLSSAFPLAPGSLCSSHTAFSAGSQFQYFMLSLFLFLSFICPHTTPCSLTSPLGYTFFAVKLLY